MKLLWMTWKDRTHPLAGGAEVVNEELTKRLAAGGHEVKLLVGGYPGCNPQETVDGYEIVRVGGRVSVYWQAFQYYRTSLRGWADLVVDEVNTVPFFAKFYVKEPNILVVHMLCRQIWFYQLTLPFSLIGWLLEPLYLRLLSDRSAITISESTKQDLVRNGFRKERISIISEGIEMEPLRALDVKKFTEPTLLSLGSIRPMKRTLDQVKAFEIAKQRIPNLKLVIAGDGEGAYGRKVLQYIGTSRYAADIEYRGRVSQAEKQQLMQQCHLLLVTSVKEGWGLVVTEAASQGTPAVVYDVDGLRDSVKDRQTGVITDSASQELAAGIVELLHDLQRYAILREQGWRASREVTFDRSYSDFRSAITRLIS